MKHHYDYTRRNASAMRGSGHTLGTRNWRMYNISITYRSSSVVDHQRWFPEIIVSFKYKPFAFFRVKTESKDVKSPESSCDWMTYRETSGSHFVMPVIIICNTFSNFKSFTKASNLFCNNVMKQIAGGCSDFEVSKAVVSENCVQKRLSQKNQKYYNENILSFFFFSRMCNNICRKCLSKRGKSHIQETEFQIFSEERDFPRTSLVTPAFGCR